MDDLTESQLLELFEDDSNFEYLRDYFVLKHTNLICIKAASLENNNYNFLTLQGLYYSFGIIVKRDYDKAYELYSQSFGNPIAIDSLGVCYWNGEGVEKDIFKSKELFQRATDLNDDKAMRCLAHYKEEFDNFI